MWRQGAAALSYPPATHYVSLQPLSGEVSEVTPRDTTNLNSAATKEIRRNSGQTVNLSVGGAEHATLLRARDWPAMDR